MKRKALALILILTLTILLNFGIYLNEAACSATLVVTVNSPQYKVYTSSDVVVSVSASDPEMNIGPESIAYSLDGEPQVIIATVPVGMHSLTGSTVLSLPNGVHSIVGIGITWYNGTSDGVFYSSPVYFTVNSESTPTQEPQLTEQEIILGVAVIVAVIVAGLGLLVYLIKRK